jgi:hypothetical protein
MNISLGSKAAAERGGEARPPNPDTAEYNSLIRPTLPPRHRANEALHLEFVVIVVYAGAGERVEAAPGRIAPPIFVLIPPQGGTAT